MLKMFILKKKLKMLFYFRNAMMGVFAIKLLAVFASVFNFCLKVFYPFFVFYKFKVIYDMIIIL